MQHRECYHGVPFIWSCRRILYSQNTLKIVPRSRSTISECSFSQINTRSSNTYSFSYSYLPWGMALKSPYPMGLLVI